MILFHAKRDGTVTTTPDLVPQGSSMQDLVVVSEFDYAYCAIRLLPASGEYIEDIPCDLILKGDGTFLWTASLPPKATVVAGSVDYQLIFTAADGTTQATLVGSFSVPRGVPVSTPSSVGELSAKTVADLYTILSSLYVAYVGHEHDIYQSLADIAALKKTVSSAGYVTIPATEWTDGMPTVATFDLDGFGKGMTAMLIPADSNTQTAAREARLSAYPVAFPIDSDTQTVEIIRADADKAPDIPLRFAYLILKTDASVAPTVAILGVDAYGEGGGTGGGVDSAAVEEIVTRLVPGWARESNPPAETDPTISDWAKAKYKPTYSKGDVGLGNVDNVKQYSADNPPPYPVTSVNGKTGEVSLTAGDVGADPDGSAEAVAARVAEDLRSYYTKTEVNGLVSAIPKFSIEAVDSLPTSGMSSTTVYLVKDKTSSGDLYTEYIYVGGAWEELGRQTVNLSGYVTSAKLTEILSDYATKTSLSTAINTALAQAKASGEFDGEDGKSAYAYAKDGGYAGTEAEFAEDMNPDNINAYIIDELAKRGQLKPENAQSLEWLEENGDTSKLYFLSDKSDPNYGYIYAWMLTETEVETDGYNNRLEKATTTYNGTTIHGEDYDGDGAKDGYLKNSRLSSSGSENTSDGTGMLATGFISASDGSLLDGARIRTVGFTVKSSPMNPYVISYDASGTKIQHYQWFNGDNASTADVYISDFVLDSATYGTGIKYIRISASAKGSTFPSVVTVNQEIKEGGTETIITEAWASTGHAFIPADYEDRIVELEAEVESLNKQIKKAKISKLSVSEVFAPSPQLPADGSETADFNGDWNVITAEAIYAKIDELLNLYPRFITKEIMGKDASGTHDWCRYICTRRAYDAWQKPNYPPMYAWVNGTTTVYSVSVSPRIGDTMYTTTYVGTAKGTVTAVSNANQTRTVGGVVYTRDQNKDIEPTLVYTETAYSPYFSTSYAVHKNGVYNGSKAIISTVSSISDGTLTTAGGESFIRYPLGDRNSRFESIPAIVIGGNEHGTGGDPATPAMISARMAKDLCECRQMDNPFLNLLKNEYMVVFCPVVNPWGLHKDNKSYTNYNGVNLDRNFDTTGWHPQSEERDGWFTGDYGGSENETQYFMNTLVASKCKVAMCNHSYGHGIDNATGEAVSGGICSYMLGREKPKYTESLLKIAEVMASNYNLAFGKNSDTATPETSAKTRSYIEWIGADGVALEMNSREGFITDPNNEAQGKQFTARVMEAAYTQLLQVLYMMIDNQD